MKHLLVLVLVAAAYGASVPSGSDKDAQILKQDQEVNFDGSYHSSFETSNGIVAQEQGQLKNAGNKDAEAEEVQGSAQWVAPDGTQVQLTYTADENGYQPQGSHLPVPPEIPAAIQRSLEWNAAHPETDDSQKQ